MQKKEKIQAIQTIQDPGLNTLAEAFFKYIYIVDLIQEIVILNIA